MSHRPISLLVRPEPLFAGGELTDGSKRLQVTFRGEARDFQDFLKECSTWYPFYARVWVRYARFWSDEGIQTSLSKTRKTLYKGYELIHGHLADFPVGDLSPGQLAVAYQAAGIANAAVLVARDLAPQLVCFEETKELLGKIKGANDQFSPGQLNHNEAGIFHMETLTRHVFIETQLGRADEGVDRWSDWCTHYILKHRIEREIKKRGEGHVGFPAAIYSFYKELERRSELTDLNGGAIGRNLEALQKRIPGRSKWLEVFKARDFNFNKGGYMAAESELRSQTAMTLEKELTEDPFSLLKKGLEGKLNFIPVGLSS